MLFSQRKGLKPIRSVIQVDSMDDDLRNSLWNILTTIFWEQSSNYYIKKDPKIKSYLTILWFNFFKEPLDTIDAYWPDNHSKIKERFFSYEWFEVYDFIEFVANYFDTENSRNKAFISLCNNILKRELSGYRFVDRKVTQITSEEEIAEIEEALTIPDSLNSVKQHIKTSLDLFSDRKSPDYRNSIKESISAVESICNLIGGGNKCTLGNALKEIESKVALHPALKKAFESLYGYTNDAGGIRHALMKDSNLDFEDAKFMLVSCSAFINYLISKSAKAGINL